jgi:RsiW-degrading membrane proteinase PrsW (M82 family)
MDAILTNTKAWASGLAGLVLVGAAIHEWLYHQHHRYAPGPSEVLAVGFLAGGVVAFVVMFIAKELTVHQGDIYAHLTDAERRQKAEYLRSFEDER